MSRAFVQYGCPLVMAAIGLALTADTLGAQGSPGPLASSFRQISSQSNCRRFLCLERTMIFPIHTNPA